jgi:predicted N-acetyltransferase YhbS
MPPDLTIRAMTAADVPHAQALTASFGWPHRQEDWALMQALGRGVVAEQNGRLVGTALCWRYGADWATLGLIGVYAELQGQGVGQRLLRTLMAELEDRSLALYATRAGMSLYAAEGFAPTGTVVQYQGIAARPEPAPPPHGMHLRPAAPADLPALAALDRLACGMDRTHLLATLLDQPGGVALDHSGAVTGFALLRRFGRGHVIGPVAAPDVDCAKAMIAPVLDRYAGQFLRIDIPKESGLSAWLAATTGLIEAGAVIRMVRGTDASARCPVHTFGLASQAFG